MGLGSSSLISPSPKPDPTKGTFWKFSMDYILCKMFRCILGTYEKYNKIILKV